MWQSVSSSLTIRTIEGRRPPNLHLIPNERESFWVQSKQPHGRTITQIALRFDATNLTNGPIRLASLTVAQPWMRAQVIDKVLIVRHPNEIYFGHDNPILEGATSPASCTIILDRPIGRARASMTVVVKISDQYGRWHKLKFRKLRWAGA